MANQNKTKMEKINRFTPKGKRCLVVFKDFLSSFQLPAGSICIANMIRTIQKEGWEVALLTLKGDRSCPDFVSESSRAREFLLLIPNTPLYAAKGWFRYPKDFLFHLFGKKVSSSRPPIASFTPTQGGERKFPIWKAYNWLYRLWRKYLYCYLQMLSVGFRAVAEFQPSIIIASYITYEDLLIGSRLSALTGIPWIAYIMDPLKTGLFERRVLNTASAIISTMDEWDYAGRKVALYPIHHGFDPSKYPPLCQSLSLFTITCIIRRYVRMHLVLRFLRVISKLEKEGFFQKFPLKCSFYMLDYIPEISEWQEKLNLQCLEILPAVSHKEMLRKEVESSLLLLFGWEGDWERIQFTTKFWEFIGSSRPILRIGRGDHSEAKILQKLRAGYAFEKEEEIYNFLKKALKDFYTKGDIDWNPDREAISTFAFPNLAKKWDEILEKYRRK